MVLGRGGGLGFAGTRRGRFARGRRLLGLGAVGRLAARLLTSLLLQRLLALGDELTGARLGVVLRLLLHRLRVARRAAVRSPRVLPVVLPVGPERALVLAHRVQVVLRVPASCVCPWWGIEGQSVSL
ncbi:MAG: hypothetical protein SangKO_044300 [Sandaracinaceae bacterium]